MGRGLSLRDRSGLTVLASGWGLPDLGRDPVCSSVSGQALGWGRSSLPAAPPSKLKEASVVAVEAVKSFLHQAKAFVSKVRSVTRPNGGAEPGCGLSSERGAQHRAWELPGGASYGLGLGETPFTVAPGSCFPGEGIAGVPVLALLFCVKGQGSGVKLLEGSKSSPASASSFLLLP